MSEVDKREEGDKEPVKVSKLLEKFEAHRDFTRLFFDAFALIDVSRRVIKFNQAFCTLAGVRAFDVRRAESIDELFSTEVPGTTKSAVDLILESTSPLRVDEVQAKRVVRQDDEPVQTIIGSYPYLDDDGSMLGACILIRDVTAENNLQGKYQEKSLQSITDPLTGLFTRRYFEDWLEKELERCRMFGQDPTLGLLMFDLDKFKTVNDTYGHQAGDFVLLETAKILKTLARKSDIVGRFGGEELLIVLVGVNVQGCCVAAEKFRSNIESHEFIFEGKRIPVTSSVGCSVFLSRAENRSTVVARADACLYAAKHAGRNVCFGDFGEGPQLVKSNIDKRF